MTHCPQSNPSFTGAIKKRAHCAVFSLTSLLSATLTTFPAHVSGPLAKENMKKFWIADYLLQTLYKTSCLCLYRICSQLYHHRDNLTLPNNAILLPSIIICRKCNKKLIIPLARHCLR